MNLRNSGDMCNTFDREIRLASYIYLSCFIWIISQINNGKCILKASFSNFSNKGGKIPASATNSELLEFYGWAFNYGPGA
jgi:hypothetical protein